MKEILVVEPAGEARIPLSRGSLVRWFGEPIDVGKVN